MMARDPTVRPAFLLALLAAACAGEDGATATATAGASATTSGGATTEASTSDSTAGSATSETTTSAPTTTTTSATTTTATTTTTTGETATTLDTTGRETTGTTGADGCGCVADNERILVLSDDDEIWAYTPAQDAFELLSDVICPGATKPYSMAVDRQGLAWIQYAGDGQIYTFDPKAPAPCEFAGVLVGQAGLDYVGLSFAPISVDASCDRLFLFNYSGSGPFKEGPGLGALGVFDPLTDVTSKIGVNDYDGGELAGTGEGRLFAFAGVDPAKLIELDQGTGAVISTLPLAGLRKTRASAFAFHGGDAYFFTEATDLTCDACLAVECPAEQSACAIDPVCAEALACSVEMGSIQDECGGLMTQSMINCATGPCIADCYPGTPDIYSKVTRLDYDDSEGEGQVLTLVNPKGPDRIVGAAASTCAPYLPQ